MPTDPASTGLSHIALRVSDLARARRFYAGTLGFPVLLDAAPHAVVIAAGGIAFGLLAPTEQTPAGDTFSPFRVGLDHVALACADEAELDRVAAALAEAGVESTGAKTDAASGKRYVAFKDPDRIQWEFYLD